MLLRGVYTFEPRPEDHEHTLSFTYNDNLVFLEVLRHDINWIKVADILGRIGYVPKSFTEPIEDYENHELILSFLADAVVKARQNGLASAPFLEALRDEVRDHPSLVEERCRNMLKVFNSKNKAKRSASEQTMSKSFTPENMRGKPNASLRRTGSDVDARTKFNDKVISGTQTRHHAATNYMNASSNSSVRTATEGVETGTEDVLPLAETSLSTYRLQEIKSKLVNVVQETSGLGEKLSEDLLIEVFQKVKESTSTLPVETILNKLAASPPKPDQTLLELQKIMNNLSKLSKDSIREGKSSGHLGRAYEASFLEKLDMLRKLLIDCDPFRIAQLLQTKQHSFSQDLVHLYHMGSPTNIKEKILDVFLIICTIDRKGRKKLLSTTLPLTLARELMAGTKGLRVFKQQMDLLISLLTSGETMPETHYEILGTGFVHFLLMEIEDAFRTSCDWDYNKLNGDVSAMINLILAYNLQFVATKENIVLRVFAESRKRPRGFLTIVIDLFKKAFDPLRLEVEDEALPVPNSVFKMISEICLCQRTKGQLTPRDVQDMMDAIRDGLIGNPAGNVRLGYIQVLHSLLSSFPSNLKDIRTALLSILLDTDPLAIAEQQLIRTTSKEFPELFMRTISRMRINVNADDKSNDDESDHENQDQCSYLSS